MKGRLVFLDLLRGWATLVMVEVHVFNAFMQTSCRGQEWFGVLNYVNGLVAPSFIFIAGFVFVIVGERKLEAFRTFGAVFWKQLGRIVLILGTGYFLHLPSFPLSRMLRESTPDSWLRFAEVDVLHCIAVGLLILFILRIVIRPQDVFGYILLVLALGTIFASPFLWDHDFSLVMPPFLAAYINGTHYSLFPLFPWLGFMLAAGFLASQYTRFQNEQREELFIKRLALVSVLMIVVSHIIPNPHDIIGAASPDARSNPWFFAERLGIVQLLLVACWFYARKRNTETSFVLDISRESLLVYTVHLLLIYGLFFGDRSLSSLYGGSLSPALSAGATLLLALLMVLLAKVWGGLKRNSPGTARITSYATIGIILLVFVAR